MGVGMCKAELSPPHPHQSCLCAIASLGLWRPGTSSLRGLPRGSTRAREGTAIVQL